MFVHDNHCIACLKLFHCRTRVMCHIRNAPQCARAIAEADLDPLADDLVQALADEEIKARKALFRASAITPALRRPFLQAYGPLPYWAASFPAR